MKTHAILSLVVSLLLSLVVAPLFAQETSQYAIYNYRNDGKFNAWLNVDIDSITFSRIDTLGVEHEDIVVQEVWTADSVYRIPMDAIDSIGFRTPEPEFRDDIFHITENHLPYTISVDSLSITFSSTIPTSLLPSKGQVVISDTFEEPFGDGFAGRVQQIGNDNNNIVITCSQVAITDIFRRLVIVGKGVSEEADEKNKAPQAWTDPLIGLEAQGIKKIDLPKELKLNILGDVMTVKSKNPTLTVSYCFYIDDVIYSFSADAFISHSDLSFEVAFKLSDFMKVAETGSEYLTNFILGKGDEEKASEKWYEHEYDNVKLPIPFSAGPVNFTFEIAPIFKLKGDVELDLTCNTSARQHLGFYKSGYTAILLAPNPYLAFDFGDLNYNYVQDPIQTKQLTAKASGSASLGVSLQLKANLVSKNLIQAAVGGEYTTSLSGDLQFNLYDSGDQITSFYDVIKDTKVKVSEKVKIKGEIGTLKYLTLKGSFDIPIEEYSYYLVPHFTKPELPQYKDGHWTYNNPLSLYSKVSKDLLIECKPGLLVEDLEGNRVTKYTSTEPYRYEAAWIYTPLELSIAGITPNKTYRCYPTFSMFGLDSFKAGPYYEFTVPKPMSASPETLSFPVGATWIIEIVDGWGTFAVAISGDNDVISIVQDEDSDPRHIKIAAEKVGNTNLQIEDRRAGRKILVPITVTESYLITNNIKVEPTEIDFGEVAVEEPHTEYFTINNISDKKQTLRVEIEGSNNLFTDGFSLGEEGVEAGDNFLTVEIPVGGSYRAAIEFRPIAAEEYVTHIFISSVDVPEDKYIVTVKGKGIETEKSFHLSANSISLYVNTDSPVTIFNGSGDYDVINENPDIVDYDINGVHVAHAPSRYFDYGRPSEGDLWWITAKKIGEASLKLIDKQTNKELSLSVTVIQAPSLSLAQSNVEMNVGETKHVEILTGSEWYEVTADNNSVVSVSKATISTSGGGREELGSSYTGIYVIIEALSAGEAIVTVKDLSSGETEDINVRVSSSNPSCPVAEAIDLGLPSGTKWASWNVGASKPEEYGGYYAWGETEEKDFYNWSTYIHCDGSSSSCHHIGDDIAGTEYDVAHVKWGGSWRMPTRAQQDELRENCTREWTQQNGVNGIRVTGPNGNSIFLPAAGGRWFGTFRREGSNGYYWSSSLDISEYNACILLFHSDYWGWFSYRRDYGHSVRAVCP